MLNLNPSHNRKLQRTETQGSQMHKSILKGFVFFTAWTFLRLIKIWYIERINAVPQLAIYQGPCSLSSVRYAMCNKDISLTAKVSSKSETWRTVTFHKTFKMYSLPLQKIWRSGAINVGPLTPRTMNVSNTNCFWESESYSGLEDIHVGN